VEADSVFLAEPKIVVEAIKRLVTPLNSDTSQGDNAELRVRDDVE
jgi:hypothetical protein